MPAAPRPDRRQLALWLAMALAAPGLAGRSLARSRRSSDDDDDDDDAPPARSETRKQPEPTDPDAGQPGDVVRFSAPYPPGAIVISNDERRLYYVLGADKAIRYPIAIGTSDEIWTGRSFVQSKIKDPVWKPPWNPDEVIPAGPENPLGERAIYLDWSLYRIHGTNAPNSIGRSASHGCFRMHNKHVKDLYNRVHIGAPVYVVDALSDPIPPRRENKPPPESD